MIQPPFFIFHPLPKSLPLRHPHQPLSQHVHSVMAAYNIFGFQSCALKVTCTVTCFITWSVT